MHLTDGAVRPSDRWAVIGGFGAQVSELHVALSHLEMPLPFAAAPAAPQDSGPAREVITRAGSVRQVKGMTG